MISSVNYALRILKPVLEGSASAVEVKSHAEDQYVQDMQAALKKTVWHAGCYSVDYFYPNPRTCEPHRDIVLMDFCMCSGTSTTKPGMQWHTPGARHTSGIDVCFLFGGIGMSRFVLALNP